MRYFAIFFSAIYVLFAYWQINDPDPVWWVTLYLVPAFISFRAFKKKFSLEVLVILSVLYAACAVNSFQQITNAEGFFTENAGLDMKTMNQELAREASGLSICVFTYLTYSVYFLIKNKRESKSLESERGK
jgi:hypothetical protein